MQKFQQRGRPHILIPEDTWNGMSDKLKVLFNESGYWIDPVSLPVSLNGEKVSVALFTNDQLSIAGKKGHKGWIGKQFTDGNVTYTVFPDVASGIDDEDGFERAMKLLAHRDFPHNRIHIIQNEKDLRSAIKHISSLPYVVCDFETRELDPFNPDASVLSLAAGNKDQVWVMPLSHPKSPWLGNTEVQMEWLSAVYGVKHLVGHNAKYELRWFLALGFPVRAISFDPMVVHHMFYEWRPHDLETLAADYTDWSGYSYELAGSLQSKNDYSTAPLDLLLIYNGMDVIVTDVATTKLRNKLAEADNEDLAAIWQKLDRPLISLLAEMEHNGLHIDVARLQWLGAWYDEEIDKCEDQLQSYAPLKAYFEENPPNFGSPVQMRKILYEQLRFKAPYNTKPSKSFPQGVPSTDREALRILEKSGKHTKFMQQLQRRNRASKIKTSFIDVFQHRMNWQESGYFLRTNYNQHVVETFRLSSSSPNLQNLPRSEDLASIQLEAPKQVFTSRYGNHGRLVQADFSQLELRVAAMYTGDKTFCDAFEQGRDLHGELATVVYGEGWTKEQRYKAKRANFSAVFDVSAEGLADQIDASVDEAKKILAAFRSVHPELLDWFNRTWDEAKYHGMVKNFLGRERHIEWEMSRAMAAHEVDAIRRSVYNFPIQSTAADMTKTALLKMRSRLVTEKLDAVIVGTVHDSIIIDSHVDCHSWVAHILKYEMENIDYDWITVPVKADISIGEDLHNLVELP